MCLRIVGQYPILQPRSQNGMRKQFPALVLRIVSKYTLQWLLWSRSKESDVAAPGNPWPPLHRNIYCEGTPLPSALRLTGWSTLGFELLSDVPNVIKIPQGLHHGYFPLASELLLPGGVSTVGILTRGGGEDVNPVFCSGIYC